MFWMRRMSLLLAEMVINDNMIKNPELILIQQLKQKYRATQNKPCL
ncbi:hypothetical protein SAMN03080594_10896 [Arenibacter palladensis]|uniref:Uncharacterized protein n=1 Tax=Arenibacter palladensis TaxID=237373 RepID=A0A1M5F1A1_9FLAO|nr:hypothetical protein SAMN03080594_10896 [Arenibacter palladensis]